MSIDLRGTEVLVVGAGIMGAGIVQVAALAGHPVKLFDARRRGRAGAGEAGGHAEVAGRQGPARCRGRARRDGAHGADQLAGAGARRRPGGRGHRREPGCQAQPVPRARRHPRTRRGAGHQHLVDQRHGHRQRPAASAAPGRHALLQPGAADEAGRGGARPADRCGGGRCHLRVVQGLGARRRCMRRARRGSSSTGLRGRSMRRLWRCCRNRPPRRRCSTPA